MINWVDLGSAIALVLVIEGLLPLLSPAKFRTSMLAAVQLNDRVLRAVGFVSMCAGALMLFLVR